MTTLASASARPAPTARVVSAAPSSEGFPVGLVLILGMIGALAAIIAVAYYLASQMPV